MAAVFVEYYKGAAQFGTAESRFSEKLHLQDAGLLKVLLLKVLLRNAGKVLLERVNRAHRLDIFMANPVQ